jgi:hypothetical protein
MRGCSLFWLASLLKIDEPFKKTPANILKENDLLEFSTVVTAS